ncbi:PEGA domain-containing protein [Sorangium cellulosum]|uniref:PEGA domain-containing protein n=1 Tax=Sorangium cellulosum TaxID=56 RepID=UPI000CF3F220|nr:PEGA domain-containing protein [Sorangium cellulosum]
MLALSACLSRGGAARAAEPSASALPITVIALRTDDAYDQADALTRALRSAIKDTPGWSVGEGDFSLEVLTLSLQCSDVPDAACQTRIADQIKSDRYLWGVIRKEGTSVVGELHLFRRGQPAANVPVKHSANLTEGNDETLRKIAADAVAALTGGPPKGSLRVRTGAAQATVLIDGKAAGAVQNGEATFTVTTGPHRVIVKSPGFLDAEASVTVQPVATTDVALSQVPVESSQPGWKRVGGFVGLGAGAVFGTVAVISSIQVATVPSDPRFKAYRALFDRKVEDVCAREQRQAIRADVRAETRTVEAGISLCERADTHTALQLVLYPLAAISAGVGAYLLVTSGEGRSTVRPGLTVQPNVSLDTGGLDVTYRW